CRTCHGFGHIRPWFSLHSTRIIKWVGGASMGISSSSAVRAFAVALAAATLAACAQPAMMADRLQPPCVPAAEEPQATPPPARKKPATPAAKERAAKDRAASVTGKPAGAKRATTYGLASFYNHRHARTANGETFDPGALTAAHPTLPFGTRVRVTELKNGRWLTVRTTARGPFVPGRIVDASKSAAEELGIVGRGIARVKLEVVDPEPVTADAGYVRHAHAE